MSRVFSYRRPIARVSARWLMSKNDRSVLAQRLRAESGRSVPIASGHYSNAKSIQGFDDLAAGLPVEWFEAGGRLGSVSLDRAALRNKPAVQALPYRLKSPNADTRQPK